MKIDSAISVAIAKAQQYLQQQEAYMMKVENAVEGGQSSSSPDIDFQIRSRQQRTERMPEQNQATAMTEAQLNAIASTLLSMRYSLQQATANEEETVQNKQVALHTEQLQQQKQLIFEQLQRVAPSNQTQQEQNSSSDDANTAFTSPQTNTVGTIEAAVSEINNVLQQIARSRVALRAMQTQARGSSSILTDGATAKQYSLQAKEQILTSTNSLQSQAYQNPTILSSLL